MDQQPTATDLAGLPLTRAAAKAVGAKRYYSTRPCSQGHSDGRWTTNKACITCHRAKTVAWQQANKPKVRASQRKHFLANREKCNAAASAWQKKNPHRNAASVRLYNAKKRHAQPAWLTPAQIGEIHAIYAEAHAKGLTVDHIDPLNGKLICGLHVPWNLQLLSRAENTAKGNKFEPRLWEA